MYPHGATAGRAYPYSAYFTPAPPVCRLHRFGIYRNPPRLIIMIGSDGKDKAEYAEMLEKY